MRMMWATTITTLMTIRVCVLLMEQHAPNFLTVAGIEIHRTPLFLTSHFLFGKNENSNMPPCDDVHSIVQ